MKKALSISKVIWKNILKCFGCYVLKYYFNQYHNITAKQFGSDTKNSMHASGHFSTTLSQRCGR